MRNTYNFQHSRGCANKVINLQTSVPKSKPQFRQRRHIPLPLLHHTRDTTHEDAPPQYSPSQQYSPQASYSSS